MPSKQRMSVLGLVNVLGSTLMNVIERYLPMACGYDPQQSSRLQVLSKRQPKQDLEIESAPQDVSNAVDGAKFFWLFRFSVLQ